ncbi:MAG TPA: SPFH domain-containing protein [Burkholderiaceae bacterium]|nr:SPFH domain-containing protein [Burkholderiaceae bacterium]
MDSLFKLASIAVPSLVALALLLALLRLSGSVRYIGNSRIGIVEKLWSAGGSIRGGFIALRGEAGFQPDVLRGGFHVFAPLQYRVHVASLVTIPQGKIGYVFARDGQPLAPGQTLASNRAADEFQDVRAFLAKGGQKGPQRKVLREGTYAINLAQFVIVTDASIYSLRIADNEAAILRQMQALIADRDGFEGVIIRDSDDKIGVVTVHDGPALSPGEIIAPTVGDDPTNAATFHNSFQNPEAFLAGAGRRGRQYQVLVEGTYYVNRLFATVEFIQKTVIPIGFVGVVVSFTGRPGEDTSGADYRHGELVAKGCRGVWQEPLLPGKYAFNTYAGVITLVPTTNFILKWAKGQTGEHKFDENLMEVSLITKDAFEPTLPLSVVVHIDYRKAPLVVQRFGDIKKLVEQTLDPMVSAYFKNIGQTKTLIELLQERSDIQDRASREMREKFLNYNLELQEVLIGTPNPAGGAGIEQILDQLRSRQVAREKVETFKLLEQAALQERSFREREAEAKQQTAITESTLAIMIRENEGSASLAKTRKDAESVEITARAIAAKTRLEGEGEAARVASIGLAEAQATKAKVDAFGGPQYQLSKEVALRFAEAIEKGHIAVVPQVQVGGGAAGDPQGAGASSGIVNAFLGALLAQVRREPPAAAKARDAS